MGRPHIEFIHSSAVAARPLEGGPFAGCDARMLSEDPETGASTSLVELRAGQAVDLTGGERAVELFGLGGELALAGRRFSAGSYAFVAPGATNAVLADAAGGGGLVLVMIEELGLEPGSGPVEVLDTNQMRLEDHGVAGVPPGLVIKLLHVDRARGDWTWICAGPPGWQEDRAEIHPTVEEALVLRGDVLLGERGGMVAGDYFWRPPNVRHGPMYSRGGNLIFFRTKGGGMEVTYEAVPGWQRLVDDYRDAEPLYLGG
jgi:hypothetical protein